jgi:hypothetical protein
MEINYTERMWNYYPEVIKAILEFQSIIESEAPEIESLNNAVQRILEDAYLRTMSEDRIKQWEKVLNIVPIAGSSFEDRRETIIARILGQGKLNTKKIEEIVKVFTGGTATSWVKNNTLYVEVTPPPTSKDFLFPNLEQELKRKIPAHLGFKVARNYFTWGDVNEDHSNWQQVYDENNPDDDITNDNGWREVLLFVPEGFDGGVEIQ